MLIVHATYRATDSDGDRITLEITYHPNQGWDETATVTAKFGLID